MKIAIVGGSGFIGTRLCDRLIKNKEIHFSIFDKEKSNKYPKKWSWCDVRDIDSLRKCLKGYDVVVNLAAEHKDNVEPISLYYDVNVDGQRNLCKVMEEFNIQHLVFTSSVAVYGFVEKDTDESGSINPFNHYGKSKYQSEEVARQWFSEGKALSIIRPTVVFGEGNRGNVYNLLKQVASGKFIMIGGGKNKKSMAYVENVAAFLEHLISNAKGYQVFNYADKQDFDMNTLVTSVNSILGKSSSKFRLPYAAGLMIGTSCDFVSKVIRKELPISKIRVKKFCATTQFKTSSNYAGFKRQVSLQDALTKVVQAEF